MTLEEIKRLRALLAEATSGPWRMDTKDRIGENWLIGSIIACGEGENEQGFFSDYIVTTDNIRASELDGEGARADAELIAAARNALPALLDLAEEGLRAREAREAPLQELARRKAADSKTSLCVNCRHWHGGRSDIEGMCTEDARCTVSSKWDWSCKEFARRRNQTPPSHGEVEATDPSNSSNGAGAVGLEAPAHLSIEDQMLMDKALRRSFRRIVKG